MRVAGYEYNASGLGAFIEEYGVLEQITTTTPSDNDTSDATTTHRVRERPSVSPRLFGDHLMSRCGFIFLKDIAANLPSYDEWLVPVAMGDELRKAYGDFEGEAKNLLNTYRGNRSVLSKLMHALLLYPQHPFGIGPLYATRWDGDSKRRVRFQLASPPDLPRNVLYPKELALIEDIRKELVQ